MERTQRICVGDVVARLGHSRRMLVTDFNVEELTGTWISCAWSMNGNLGPVEAVFHESALRLISRARV